MIGMNVNEWKREWVIGMNGRENRRDVGDDRRRVRENDGVRENGIGRLCKKKNVGRVSDANGIV